MDSAYLERFRRKVTHIMEMRTSAFESVRKGFRRELILSGTVTVGKLLAVTVLVAVISSGYAYLGDNPLLRASFGNMFIVWGGLLAGFIAVAAGCIALGRQSLIPVGILVVLASVTVIGVAAEAEVLYFIGGGVLGFAFSALPWNRERAQYWLVFTLLIWVMFIAATWVPTVSILSVEPQGSGWTFDPTAYVKMFYLMKRGMDYFQAYFTASIINAGLDPSQLTQKPQATFLALRSPFLSYLWLLLPNASFLYGAYLLVASIGILCGYLAFSRSDLKVAVLSAAVLVPYFTLALGSTQLMWLEWEFWGVVFSLVSLTLYARGHRVESVVPAFLAVACKENLAGILLGGLLASALRKNRRELLAWAAGLVSFITYFILEYIGHSRYWQLSSDVSSRFGGGLGFVESTFRFSLPWLAPEWYLLIAFLSALGVLWIRPRHLAVVAFSVTLLPMLVFLVFGKLNDEYWGAAYVPFVLMFAVNGVVQLCQLHNKIPRPLASSTGEKSRSPHRRDR